MDVKIVNSIKLNFSQLEVNKGQIKGLPANPRFIKDNNFKKLKKSLQEDSGMLALRELLVFKHGEKYIIIGGNMRYRALKELGETEAICKVIPPDTSVEELRSYILKDNAGYGEWDFDMLGNEWDQELVEDCCIDIPDLAEEEEEETEEDDFPVEDSLEEKTQIKLGDIYQLGEHRVICGDSTKKDFVKAVFKEGEMADLLLTDPPYNVDYVGGTKDKLKINNDHMTENIFLNFLSDAFAAADNMMKPGAAFYIWHADTARFTFLQATNSVLWKIRECLIWVKNTLVLGRQDYQWRHEPCLYGWKDGAAHYFVDKRSLTTIFEDDIDIDSLSKEDLKNALLDIRDEFNRYSTIINEDKPSRSEDHPTMKPIKLFARSVRNSTRPKGVVLDIFGGSGTTLIVCEQLGRKCRIVENDPKYVNVIIKRWETFTGEHAVYLGNVAQTKEKKE